MSKPLSPVYTQAEYEDVTARVEAHIQHLVPRVARAFAAECAARVQVLYTAWYPGDERLAAAIAAAHRVAQAPGGAQYSDVLTQGGPREALDLWSHVLDIQHAALEANREALDNARAALDLAKQSGLGMDTIHTERLLGASKAAGAAVSCLYPDAIAAAIVTAENAAQARYHTMRPKDHHGVTFERFRTVEERFWQLSQLEPQTHAH